MSDLFDMWKKVTFAALKDTKETQEALMSDMIRGYSADMISYDEFSDFTDQQLEGLMEDREPRRVLEVYETRFMDPNAEEVERERSQLPTSQEHRAADFEVPVIIYVHARTDHRIEGYVVRDGYMHTYETIDVGRNILNGEALWCTEHHAWDDIKPTDETECSTDLAKMLMLMEKVRATLDVLPNGWVTKPGLKYDGSAYANQAVADEIVGRVSTQMYDLEKKQNG